MQRAPVKNAGSSGKKVKSLTRPFGAMQNIIQQSSALANQIHILLINDLVLSLISLFQHSVIEREEKLSRVRIEYQTDQNVFVAPALENCQVLKAIIK